MERPTWIRYERGELFHSHFAYWQVLQEVKYTLRDFACSNASLVSEDTIHNHWESNNDSPSHTYNYGADTFGGLVRTYG